MNSGQGHSQYLITFLAFYVFTISFSIIVSNP